jgi:phenylalanyl-tRNA synthetase beta chain
MQISLKWINELVHIQKLNLSDLIEKLTLGGFEVEEIVEIEIENQKQIILDISATANRSDSLSIQGFSTEISALLNKEIEISSYLFNYLSWKKIIKESSNLISINNKYSKFIAVVIENINDIKIPKWIQQKLNSSGIITTNNILDFQNYILLETGYPFEFYDYDKIINLLNSSKFNLSISEAESNQKFFASNHTEYLLNDSILLVKANQLPISIAGIIVNNSINCSATTNSLLIEASIFNSTLIRQQSRYLGLRTDRSARYEKSIKSTYIIEALYRLISLLRISNPNLICKLHTNNDMNDPLYEPIILKYHTINEVLGPLQKDRVSYISIENISDYLKRLNFEFYYNFSELTWEVKVPHLRSDDITREIDLIEEIGRLHGFNNFLTQLPKIKTITNKDATYQTRNKITSCLLSLGLNELIHYSLVNEVTFIENEIKLINPLLSDCCKLRVSLLPNLIRTVQENLKQGNLFIEGFEYGHVFSSSNKDSTNFQEKEKVAGIFGGIKTKLTWFESEKSINWFEAKGRIEQFFSQLNLPVEWKASSNKKINQVLHTYKSADIYLLNKERLGTFGQINLILAKRLEIPSELYLFEFDLAIIKDQIQKNYLTAYKPYSVYPKIIKDLSFIVKQTVPFDKLKKVLYSNGTKFLSEIYLLDEYKSSSLPEQHTSLCIELVFQSNETTLQNKEIENIITNLKSVLTEKFDAIIRD